MSLCNSCISCHLRYFAKLCIFSYKCKTSGCKLSLNNKNSSLGDRPSGNLRTYKEENIRLKATVRAYEMKFRQNGFDNDMFMREAEETNPEIFIPEDIKAAKALLDTPITELKFDIRSQRIISEADIKTLRELLQITSQYGFRKLRDMLRNFGLVSQKKVEKRLKELNVLDVAGNCNLYRYLDE